MTNAQFAQLTSQISALSGQVDHMTERIDSVDERFNSIDGRLDGIDGRLDGIDGRLDGIDDTLTKINCKLTDHDQSFERLYTYMATQFDRVDQKFADVDKEIAGVYGIMSEILTLNREYKTELMFVKRDQGQQNLWIYHLAKRTKTKLLYD